MIRRRRTRTLKVRTTKMKFVVVFLIALATHTFQAEDVNECQWSNQTCPTDPTVGSCQDTEDDYTCVCQQGYKLTADGHRCEDIDECELSNHTCANGPAVGSCLNTPGDYTCQCEEGYTVTADGHQCQELADLVDASYIDIDECEFSYHTCPRDPAVGSCQNIAYPGDYTCLCEEGYYLTENKHQCEDDMTLIPLPLLSTAGLLIVSGVLWQIIHGLHRKTRRAHGQHIKQLSVTSLESHNRYSPIGGSKAGSKGMITKYPSFGEWKDNRSGISDKDDHDYASADQPEKPKGALPQVPDLPKRPGGSLADAQIPYLKLLADDEYYIPAAEKAKISGNDAGSLASQTGGNAKDAGNNATNETVLASVNAEHSKSEGQVDYLDVLEDDDYLTQVKVTATTYAVAARQEIGPEDQAEAAKIYANDGQPGPSKTDVAAHNTDSEPAKIRVTADVPVPAVLDPSRESTTESLYEASQGRELVAPPAYEQLPMYDDVVHAVIHP